MSKYMKYGLLVSCIVGLTACVSEPHLGENFGHSIRANQQAQVVNPNAAQGEAKAVMLDGQKAEEIIRGYREEKGDIETDRLLEGVTQ